jgi:hypothetical protein
MGTVGNFVVTFNMLKVSNMFTGTLMVSSSQNENYNDNNNNTDADVNNNNNNKKKNTFWEELIAYFPWSYTERIENDVSNNFSIVAFVFVTAETFLQSRCLETTGGIFTEPSSYLATIRRYTYRHTD